MDLLALEAATKTEWDYSVVEADAQMGAGWMWRPQRDIIANLFLSANDKKLAELVKSISELPISGETLVGSKTKMFYRGERLKDTKELLANASIFNKAMKIYLAELKAIAGRVEDMGSEGKWEDKDEEHYEEVIKVFGEGFGGRKLKRKSLLGMYSVVVLDGDSVNKSQLVDIEHNASKQDFVKVMGELYETYLDIKKASDDMGRVVKVTMELKTQFKALHPSNYAIISKYYAAACNPYIGLVRLSNQLITSLYDCAKAIK